MRKALEEVVGLQFVPQRPVEGMRVGAVECAGGFDASAASCPSCVLSRGHQRLANAATAMVGIDDESCDATPRPILVEDGNEDDRHEARQDIAVVGNEHIRARFSEHPREAI
jgi:hypothetical protein